MLHEAPNALINHSIVTIHITNACTPYLFTLYAGGVLMVGLGSARSSIVAMFESAMHVPPALSATKPIAARSPWLQPILVGECRPAIVTSRVDLIYVTLPHAQR